MPGGRGPDRKRSQRRDRRACPATLLPLESAEHWLARHRAHVLSALVLASIAVRIGFFVQLNATPLIELHRWEMTDMHYYDGWGRKIAEGDWRSASVTVPMHEWQIDVAAEYFRKHPEERAALAERAAGKLPATTAETLLWTQWMGGHRFYQDPLYPYLIALTYRVARDDVRFVFAWQLALGVLSNVLIWALARRYFGDLVAACAGALAVLCGPLVYYELILLRESLIAFAGLGLVWLADRALSRGHGAWFGALGLAFGIACQLKSSLLVIGAAVGAAAIWSYRERWLRMLVPAGAAAAGLVLALAPLAARNLALGVSPVSLASMGPATFIISNVLDYPVEKGFAIATPRVAQLLGSTFDHPMAAVVETLRAHTAASYAALLWRKWDRAWHWFEIPNNENFYYMRIRAPVLAWLPITFWLVGPLGLLGIAIAWTRRPRPWLLLGLVASALAPLLVFYVLGRFRVALLAALIPFAALTLVQLLRWASTRDYFRLVAAAGAVVALALWTGRPADQPLIRWDDWMTPYLLRFRAEVQSAADADDAPRAAAAFLEYFRYEPDASQIMATGNRGPARDLGRMHQACADLLRQAGQAELAKVHEDDADDLLRLAGVR